MFKAKLCRFYGWTVEYVEDLDYDLALEYSQCIAPLEARDYLVQMNIADYPNLKTQAKKKYHRSMSRVAYPNGTGKSISVEDFVRKHKYGE